MLLPALSPETLQQREAELSDRIDSELARAGTGKAIGLGEPLSSEESFGWPGPRAIRRSPQTVRQPALPSPRSALIAWHQRL